MARKDTAAAITALNGSVIDETKYSQRELDAMLDAAERGIDGQAQFDGLKDSYDSDGPPSEAQNKVADLAAGQEVVYTHSDGKEHPGRIIRVNDADSGDVAISVEALGADSQIMTVPQERWKIKNDA